MMRPTDTERTTVVREVLRLTGPAVLTSFLQTLVFLVDRILLGRYSEAALASMQVQGPLLWSLWGIFTGLLVGTVPLVARSVGARDLSRARDVARAALLLAFVLGLGVSLSCGVLARPIGDDPDNDLNQAPGRCVDADGNVRWLLSTITPGLPNACD